jgi:uncharacterized protein
MRGNVFDKRSPPKVYKRSFRGERRLQVRRKTRRRDRKMKYFLCVLGMVLIVEGLPYFAFPVRMKDWIALIAATSEKHLRGVGLALMAVGLWLVYLGRS